MINFIIKLLDLKQEDIEDISIEDENGLTTILITLKNADHICPRCSNITNKVKEYKIKNMIHQVFSGRDTKILYKCRRYICTSCNKTFNENSSFGHTYSSISNATLISILKEFKHYTSTYAQIAKRYGVSPSTVVNIFDNHIQVPRHRLQSVICIDEFYFNRHAKHKYAFMIMGFRNKLILDIVESRKQEQLSSYFFSIPIEERRQVTHVSMDMYGSYKTIITTFFPNCIICIDSFHVVKKVTDCLNSLRKRICRKYADNKDSKEYRLLKYRYKLLLKKSENINNEKYFFDRILGYTTTESGVLEELLSIDDRLRIAYNLRENYRSFNSVEENDFNKDDNEKEYASLINDFKSSTIKEMKEVGKTLKNWKKEILNSFVWFDGRRLSNGPIEGKNNYIKKMISNGNGLINFKRARNRFMYSQNKHESFTLSVKKGKIKSPGKFRGKYKIKGKNKK